MTNQTTAKCPTCGTPATQTEFHEICLRANGNASGSFAVLLETCVNPNTLEEFHSSNDGEDPCTHCEYNQITETPGSFVEIQQGASIISWLEVHVCPNCLTKYSVNPQTNATPKICS